jgi:hypothetical protein
VIRFIETFKAHRARNKFFKDPIVEFALQHWEECCVSDKTFEFSEASEKERHRDRLINTLFEIKQSENPFMKMRELLAKAVQTTTYYNVLMKHRIDKDGNPISSISHPKISWRLSDHIFKIAQKEKTLRGVIEAYGENMSDVLDCILVTYRSNHAHMSAINAVRVKMKDYVEGENWFQWFYVSMCISQEDRMRKEIGLPSLFNENDEPKGLDGLKYWSFLDFVKSGSKQPHRDWQELYASEFWK